MLLYFFVVFWGGYLVCPCFLSISVEICGWYYIQVVSVHLVCSLVYIFVIILMLLLLLLLRLLLLTIDFSTSSYLCISKQMLFPPGIALVCIFLPPTPTTTTTNKWQMQTIVMRKKRRNFLF